MDVLTIVALALIGLLVFLWIFYSRYVNAIIEDLVVDNEALKLANKRLKEDNQSLRQALKAQQDTDVSNAELKGLLGRLTGLDFPNSQPVTTKKPKDRCY